MSQTNFPLKNHFDLSPLLFPWIILTSLWMISFRTSRTGHAGRGTQDEVKNLFWLLKAIPWRRILYIWRKKILPSWFSIIICPNLQTMSVFCWRRSCKGKLNFSLILTSLGLFWNIIDWKILKFLTDLKD